MCWLLVVELEVVLVAAGRWRLLELAHLAVPVAAAVAVQNCGFLQVLWVVQKQLLLEQALLAALLGLLTIQVARLRLTVAIPLLDLGVLLAVATPVVAVQQLQEVLELVVEV
jgi:hypothetical protein